LLLPVFIPIVVPGAFSTFILGVSNNNVVVGGYHDWDEVEHGVMIAGSIVTTIDDPNAWTGTTICWGVNSSGTVVGSYDKLGGNVVQGFMYKNGVFTDVGPAGAPFSSAYGINDRGEIVGQFRDTYGAYKGFLYNGSSYQTLIPPGATSAAAFGINKTGNVTLQWLDSNNVDESSVFDGTTYTAVNVPGATGTFADGIDSAGDVVFLWTDSQNNYHSALLLNQKYYKFSNPLCSLGTYAYGINDNKIMVGTCDTSMPEGFYVLGLGSVRSEP
jgi:probable HAF family extracellular repeat protein